jgi:hypothetical protein
VAVDFANGFAETGTGGSDGLRSIGAAEAAEADGVGGGARLGTAGGGFDAVGTVVSIGVALRASFTPDADVVVGGCGLRGTGGEVGDTEAVGSDAEVGIGGCGLRGTGGEVGDTEAVGSDAEVGIGGCGLRGTGGEVGDTEAVGSDAEVGIDGCGLRGTGGEVGDTEAVGRGDRAVDGTGDERPNGRARGEVQRSAADRRGDRGFAARGDVGPIGGRGGRGWRGDVGDVTDRGDVGDVTDRGDVGLTGNVVASAPAALQGGGDATTPSTVRVANVVGLLTCGEDSGDERGLAISGGIGDGRRTSGARARGDARLDGDDEDPSVDLLRWRESGARALLPSRALQSEERASAMAGVESERSTVLLRASIRAARFEAATADDEGGGGGGNDDEAEDGDEAIEALADADGEAAADSPDALLGASGGSNMLSSLDFGSAGNGFPGGVRPARLCNVPRCCCCGTGDACTRTIGIGVWVASCGATSSWFKSSRELLIGIAGPSCISCLGLRRMVKPVYRLFLSLAGLVVVLLACGSVYM